MLWGTTGTSRRSALVSHVSRTVSTASRFSTRIETSSILTMHVGVVGLVTNPWSVFMVIEDGSPRIGTGQKQVATVMRNSQAPMLGCYGFVVGPYTPFHGLNLDDLGSMGGGVPYVSVFVWAFRIWGW